MFYPQHRAFSLIELVVVVVVTGIVIAVLIFGCKVRRSRHFQPSCPGRASSRPRCKARP